MNKSYDLAVKMIEENMDLTDFVGEISTETVNKAEKLLGVTFPESYKRFLCHYGAGNFGSEEIYGILDEDLNGSGIPDAIWFTQTQRIKAQLAPELVIIYFNGASEYYCLDTSQMNESQECPIVVYEPGITQGKARDIVYEDFGSFLFDIIQNEVS